MSINEQNEDVATLPEPKITPQHGPWAGLFMGILFPGAAHFFAGRRIEGLLWFLGFDGMGILLLCLASVPGVGFAYAAWGMLVLCVCYMLALYISSWRPVKRIGCGGWMLFWLFAVICGNILSSLTPVIVKPLKDNVVEGFMVSGMAMAPTLVGTSETPPSAETPDCLIVSKWLYRFQEPRRGDLVIFRTGSDIFIERIVGLPGETLDIESPFVQINGKRLTDPPIFETISSKQDGYNGYFRVEELNYETARVSLPMTLGADEYFLLGDNSTKSLDSRYFGPVKREKILGKAIRIYYPLSRIRELE